MGTHYGNFYPSGLLWSTILRNAERIITGIGAPAILNALYKRVYFAERIRHASMCVTFPPLFQITSGNPDGRRSYDTFDKAHTHCTQETFILSTPPPAHLRPGRSVITW